MYLALIPALNEEKSVANVVQEARKYVDYVIVVDDASVDNTSEMAQCSGAIVVRLSKNNGLGAAMITGLNYAKKLKPDIIVTLDADGQHQPKDICRLMKPILVGRADWVLGSRFLKRSPSNMPLIKHLGNKFFTFITSILSGARFTDTQTGFRAISQKALLALDLKSKFTYTQEMILILSLKGYRGVEVPIEVKCRNHGNSKIASNFIGYGFRSFITILSTYIRQKIVRE